MPVLALAVGHAKRVHYREFKWARGLGRDLNILEALDLHGHTHVLRMYKTMTATPAKNAVSIVYVINRRTTLPPVLGVYNTTGRDSHPAPSSATL
jgi:hypothetical protein